MIDKYQNKYRIPSARMQNWDYGDNGAYFITICTSNHDHFFGEITNDIMELNEIGKIAEKFWFEIPQHYPFIELGNYIVMPNHIHGILIINKTQNHPTKAVNIDDAVIVNDAVIVETPNLGVSTNPHNTTNPHMVNHIDAGKRTAAATEKWKSQTIGSIINQYKRICTLKARIINKNFGWQTRFYDHIIRNDAEFIRIQNYIENNPINWKYK